MPDLGLRHLVQFMCGIVDTAVLYHLPNHQLQSSCIVLQMDLPTTPRKFMHAFAGLANTSINTAALDQAVKIALNMHSCICNVMIQLWIWHHVFLEPNICWDGHQYA